MEKNRYLLELAAVEPAAKAELQEALLLISQGRIRTFKDSFLECLQDADFIDHKNQLTAKGEGLVKELLATKAIEPPPPSLEEFSRIGIIELLHDLRSLSDKGRL